MTQNNPTSFHVINTHVVGSHPNFCWWKEFQMYTHNISDAWSLLQLERIKEAYHLYRVEIKHVSQSEYLFKVIHRILEYV